MKKFQVRNSPLDRIATFAAILVACVKGTCVLGLSGGTALGMGLGIDELLSTYGREPIFRDTLGKGLNKVLNNLGFENPNKDITTIDRDLKALKYRYNKLKTLASDIDDLDSIGEATGTKDSDFINEIKKDIKTRIDVEKDSISKAQSKILSQLEVKDAFRGK